MKTLSDHNDLHWLEDSLMHHGSLLDGPFKGDEYFYAGDHLILSLPPEIKYFLDDNVIDINALTQKNVTYEKVNWGAGYQWRLRID